MWLAGRIRIINQSGVKDDHGVSNEIMAPTQELIKP